MLIHEQADQVRTREDLVTFIEMLSKDAEDNRERWESGTIAAYLEALASWTSSMDQAFLNNGLAGPKEPSWQLFAVMLLAASTYE